LRTFLWGTVNFVLEEIVYDAVCCSRKILISRIALRLKQYKTGERTQSRRLVPQSYFWNYLPFLAGCLPLTRHDGVSLGASVSVSSRLREYFEFLNFYFLSMLCVFIVRF
jgi:hypothetical protein